MKAKIKQGWSGVCTNRHRVAASIQTVLALLAAILRCAAAGVCNACSSRSSRSGGGVFTTSAAMLAWATHARTL